MVPFSVTLGVQTPLKLPPSDRPAVSPLCCGAAGRLLFLTSSVGSAALVCDRHDGIYRIPPNAFLAVFRILARFFAPFAMYL